MFQPLSPCITFLALSRMFVHGRNLKVVRLHGLCLAPVAFSSGHFSCTSGGEGGDVCLASLVAGGVPIRPCAPWSGEGTARGTLLGPALARALGAYRCSHGWLKMSYPLHCFWFMCSLTWYHGVCEWSVVVLPHWRVLSPDRSSLQWPANARAAGGI